MELFFSTFTFSDTLSESDLSSLPSSNHQTSWSIRTAVGVWSPTTALFVGLFCSHWPISRRFCLCAQGPAQVDAYQRLCAVEQWEVVCVNGLGLCLHWSIRFENNTQFPEKNPQNKPLAAICWSFSVTDFVLGVFAANVWSYGLFAPFRISRVSPRPFLTGFSFSYQLIEL